jgi:peptidoglycan-associated lipoprotein
MIYFRYFFLLSFLLPDSLIAQQVMLEMADQQFTNLQYSLAAQSYSKVLKKDSSHALAAFQTAECYRMSYEYLLAEKYYLLVTKKFSDDYPIARFWYATTLKDRGANEQAYSEFGKFIEENLSTEELTLKKAKLEMEGCKLEISQRNKPRKNFGLKCISQPVNSPESDFSPLSVAQDSLLFLTSNWNKFRKTHYTTIADGAFTDVYMFQQKSDTAWEIAQKTPDNFNRLNTPYNETCGSFSSNETKYYFTRCDERIKVGNYEEFNCAIYMSEKKNGQWTPAVRLNENINPPHQWNSQPSVSPDGTLIFFVSTRPGGFGQHDIWYSKSEGDDHWGPPINMGPEINTPFIDVSPNYVKEGNVLFFSSNGHPGYGGLDLFMLKMDYDKRSIIHLGIPFNSSRDDFYLTIGKHKGYLTSNRLGGIGKDDIYSFEINSKTQFLQDIELATVDTNK